MNSKMKTSREELEKLAIFKKARQFITTDGAGKLEINRDTLDEVSLIGPPLHVVVVIGPCRSGKSYLMNCLVDKKEGFHVGHTTDADTKGIWIKCLMHPKKTDEVLMVMDTEGLGDVQKGDVNHDNSLFTVALLLSSTWVYNCTKALNHNALENIAFVSEITKKIERGADRGTQDDDNFNTIPPTFIVCVRDFHLELKGTPDQLLEEALSTETNDESHNRRNRGLKNSCEVKKCFVFDSPCYSSRQLKMLPDMNEKDLEEGFSDPLNDFRTFVYDCPGKMFANRTPVTGRMFASLAKSHTETARNGGIPCEKDAISRLREAENENVIEAVLAKFTEDLSEITVPNHNKAKLQAMYEQLTARATKELRQRLLYDDCNEFESKARARMSQVKTEQLMETQRLLEEQYDESLKKRHQKVSEKMKRGAYAHIGGHEEYRKDVEEMYQQYSREEIETDEKQSVLSRFRHELRQEELTVKETDQTLTTADINAQQEKREKDMEREKANMEEKLDIVAAQQKEREKEMEGEKAKLEEKLDIVAAQQKEREKEMEGEKAKLEEKLDIVAAQQKEREKEMEGEKAKLEEKLDIVAAQQKEREKEMEGEKAKLEEKLDIVAAQQKEREKEMEGEKAKLEEKLDIVAAQQKEREKEMEGEKAKLEESKKELESLKADTLKRQEDLEKDRGAEDNHGVLHGVTRVVQGGVIVANFALVCVAGVLFHLKRQK